MTHATDLRFRFSFAFRLTLAAVLVLGWGVGTHAQEAGPAGPQSHILPAPTALIQVDASYRTLLTGSTTDTPTVRVRANAGRGTCSGSYRLEIEVRRIDIAFSSANYLSSSIYRSSCNSGAYTFYYTAISNPPEGAYKWRARMRQNSSTRRSGWSYFNGGNTAFVIDRNDAPTATDDAYTAADDQLLRIGAPEGLLSNDTDADGDALTATYNNDVSPAATVSVATDGAFTFTSAAGEGTYTFTYAVSDGNGGSATATATVTVLPNADADNVGDDTEDAVPGLDTDGDGTVDSATGDGNGDGTLDRDQSNVTSLPDAVAQSYFTLATRPGTGIADVSTTASPDPGNEPTDATFTHGFFDFTITGLQTGELAEVSIYVPDGVTPNTYYKYDAATGFTRFDYDEASGTGARILRPRSTGNPSGRTLIKLFLQDGGRGDTDGVANGTIVDPGGPGVTAEETTTLYGTDGSNNDVGWRMMALPVPGATQADLEDDLDFSVSEGKLIYRWDGQAWTEATSATELTNGGGFILYVFDDALDPLESAGTTLDVIGTAPDADVTLTGLAQADTYHLLGNPFHLGFDLSGLGLATAGFQQTAQVWDPDTQTYTVVTEAADASDVLAAWQGFFVERSTVGAGDQSLTFPIASRQADAGTFIGAPADDAHSTALASVAIPLPLRLRVLDTAEREVARDEAAVLLFHEAGTEGWDAYDASKLAPLNEAQYAALSFRGQRKGRPVLHAQSSQPLPLVATTAHGLALDIEGLNGIGEVTLDDARVPANWRVWLEDTQTGELIDLRQRGHRFPVSSSSANIAPPHQSSRPGTYQSRQAPLQGPQLLARQAADAAPRFLLHVSPDGDTTPVPLPQSISLAPPFPNPARTNVTLTYGLPESASVRVVLYDVLGRHVQTFADHTADAGYTTRRFDLGNLAGGTYFVRMETATSVRVQRLVVVR